MRAAAAACGLVACGLVLGLSGPAAPSESPHQAAAAASPSADLIVGRLSLRQQVGQVIISSFAGPRAPAYMRRRVRRRLTAGVVLFGRNVRSRGRLRSLTGVLQRASRGGALVSVDQEGGAVRRLRFAGPVQSQSAHGGAGRAGRLARAAGRQLRGAGLNVNLAPVADVAAGPSSEMWERAFRGSPGAIGRKVRAAVRGYRRARVAATAKHFPGFGAAGRNTDDAVVTINRSRRALSRRDLAPFRAAIGADTPLIMLSHARYPALDRRRIASQSPSILRLLRRRLGYRGVIVTDALEAQAVRRTSGVAAGAERSLAAGADLLLLVDPRSWDAVYPRLLRRARRSRAFRRQVRRAARRVVELKLKLGLKP